MQLTYDSISPTKGADAYNIKIMRKIILLILLTSVLGVSAQVRLSAIGQKFQLLPSNLPRTDTLDYCRCAIRYLHTYPVDNFTDGFTSVDDVLELQIGKNISKCYSYNLYLMDRNLTYNEHNNVKFRFDYIDYELFSDRSNNKLIVQHRIPYSRMIQGTTQVAQYEEAVPNIEWQITNRTDSVAGYNCFRATGHIGGRDWTVWFAPGLPFPDGPWKLGGLPGVILKAEDADAEYYFEAREISTNSEPIIRYDWHPVKMTKSKWQKTEQMMFEDPKAFFFPDSEINILDSKTHNPLEEKWKVRYNPIELE